MTAAAAAAAACLALLALVPEPSLAAFFSHDLLAQRAGVEVRASSAESARLFKAACAAAAVAWAAAVPALRLLCRGTTPQPAAAAARRPGLGDASARRGWIALLLCAAAAGLAQRTELLAHSLWFDEIAAFLDYSQWGVGASMGTYFSLANHPLHSMLVAAAIASTDTVSELTLRLPALACGLLAIPASAWLAWECAQQHPGGRSVRTHAGGTPAPLAPPALACIAAIAMLLMPLAVLESTESRGYSGMILCATLAGALWVRASRHTAEGAPAWWLGFAGACAIGCWMHPTFTALPVAYGMAALAMAAWPTAPSDRRTGGCALVALGLAAATAAALMSPLLPDALRVARELKASDGDEPSSIGIEGVLMAMQACGAWVPWAAGAGALLVVPGLARAWRAGHATRVAAFVPLVAAALLAAGTAIAGSWAYARFGLFTVPATCLAVALGVDTWLSQSRRAAALVAAATVGVAWTASTAMLGPRQQIREAVQWVAAHCDADDTVAAAGLHDNVAAMYAALISGDAAGTETIRSAGAGGSGLAAMQPAPDWLIVLYPALFERSGGAAAAATLGFTEVRRLPGWIDRGQGEVRVLSRLPQGRPAGSDPAQRSQNDG